MTLATLLDAGARFDCEYGGGLSNHLPMALSALQRLGADDARLAAFAAAYTPRLQPAPPLEAWPAGDAWTSRLGEREAWPAYRTLFRDWLAYEETEAVLAQVLPLLMPGCGAAAFHGLLRTAHALQQGHAAELADGLAYWACRHLPLDGPRDGPPDGTPPAAEHGLIVEQMQRAAAAPGFAAAVEAVPLDAGTLARLATQAAQLYAAGGDFTVLHLVTSAQALRVLLPFVDEPLAAVDDYAVAYVAALQACGAQPGPLAAPLPWDHLVAAALQSDDEHLIKLVDACREETRQHGGDLWQRAASRAVAGTR